MADSEWDRAFNIPDGYYVVDVIFDVIGGEDPEGGQTNFMDCIGRAAPEIAAKMALFAVVCTAQGGTLHYPEYDLSHLTGPVAPLILPVPASLDELLDANNTYDVCNFSLEGMCLKELENPEDQQSICLEGEENVDTDIEIELLGNDGNNFADPAFRDFSEYNGTLADFISRRRNIATKGMMDTAKNQFFQYQNYCAAIDPNAVARMQILGDSVVHTANSFYGEWYLHRRQPVDQKEAWVQNRWGSAFFIYQDPLTSDTSPYFQCGLYAKKNCCVPAPTPEPSPEPTAEPTPDPTIEPTPDPTEEPLPDPTIEPTPNPTEEPLPDPTIEPTPDPTEEPLPEPTGEPTLVPLSEPLAE